MKFFTMNLVLALMACHGIDAAEQDSSSGSTPPPRRRGLKGSRELEGFFCVCPDWTGDIQPCGSSLLVFGCAGPEDMIRCHAPDEEDNDDLCHLIPKHSPFGSANSDGHGRSLGELVQEDKNFVRDPSICNDIPYLLYLSVHEHITLVAMPGYFGLRTTCPTYQFEGIFDPTKENKKVVPYYDDIDIDENLLLLRSEKHPSTTLPVLFKVVDAVAQNEEKYDLLDNNCAAFALRVMTSFGIPADEAVVDYTVDRLFAANERLRALLQESEETDNHKRLLKFLMPTGLTKADLGVSRRLVKTFVQQYIDNHMQSARN